MKSLKQAPQLHSRSQENWFLLPLKVKKLKWSSKLVFIKLRLLDLVMLKSIPWLRNPTRSRSFVRMPTWDLVLTLLGALRESETILLMPLISISKPMVSSISILLSWLVQIAKEQVVFIFIAICLFLLLKLFSKLFLIFLKVKCSKLPLSFLNLRNPLKLSTSLLTRRAESITLKTFSRNQLSSLFLDNSLLKTLPVHSPMFTLLDQPSELKFLTLLVILQSFGWLSLKLVKYKILLPSSNYLMFIFPSFSFRWCSWCHRLCWRIR